MNVVSLRAPAQTRPPVHAVATVGQVLADGRFLVTDDQGVRHSCRRAASCLLRPLPGDVVLVSGPHAQQVFLIAVLEQADPALSHIEVAGAMVIGGGDRAVTLDTAGPLSLRGGTRLDMQAGHWSVAADRSELRGDELHVSARSVDATLGRVKLVGKVFETVADRVVQMARNVLRVVEEMDQSRVRHLDCRASETARVHARHTTVTGEDLVKVDAAQIHMG